MPITDSDRPLRFELPLRIMRGALLLTPDCCTELSKLIGGFGSKQLTLDDDTGNRYPCVLQLSERHLYGVESWRRQVKPEPADTVVLEATAKEIVAGRCRISLMRAGAQPHATGSAAWSGAPLRPPNSSDLLYLGQRLKLEYFDKTPLPECLTIPVDDLIRHVFICGVTGAGKTVLGKILVEEAALAGVPAIVIDLKGDLSSLALRFPTLRAEEFEPWVEVPRQGNRAAKAALEADRFRQQLGRFGLSAKEVADFCAKVEVNVFTPRSNKGFRLALSPFVEELSGNLESLMADDPDGFLEMLDALTSSFVKRLTFKKREKVERAKAYIFELVQHACKTGVNLQGADGLRNLIKLIEKPPVTHVAARTVDEFIGLKERAELANEVNNLLAGAGQLWFEGIPFYLDDFLSREETNRTPVNIINVSGMSHEDQSFVISHVTFSIYLWMKRHGGSQDPRLLFYIDEIGAGGGNLAFYPSHPYNPPSKPGINLLVRQGRSFGVCCVLATQSPGDVDYKGLGQCQTWIVGKLQRERELKKIQEGASEADINFKGTLKFIPTFDVGEFLVKTASGDLHGLRERWLYSYHRQLSPDEIAKIRSVYEDRAEVLFCEALRAQEAGSYDEACPVWRSFLRSFRYASKYPDAMLNLGKCLFALRAYDEAIKVLERIERRSYNRAILSEAWFLLAKCRREKTEFETAEKLFQKVASESEQPQRKQEAFIWGEYCGQAWRWELPAKLTQLRLWFPESARASTPVSVPEAVDLQLRADAIGFEPLPPRFSESLLRLPPPLPPPPESAKSTEVAEAELAKKRGQIRHRARRAGRRGKPRPRMSSLQSAQRHESLQSRSADRRVDAAVSPPTR